MLFRETRLEFMTISRNASNKTPLDNTCLTSQWLSKGNRLLEPRGSDFHRIRWRFLAFSGS